MKKKLTYFLMLMIVFSVSLSLNKDVCDIDEYHTRKYYVYYKRLTSRDLYVTCQNRKCYIEITTSNNKIFVLTKEY